MVVSPAETAIAAFERATALRVVLHAAEDPQAGLLDPARFLHLQPVCVVAKGLRLQRCTAIDGRRCSDAALDGQVHLKLCHAGLVEWIVGVPVGGRRRWLLFAGQRRPGPDLAVEMTQRVETGPWRRELGALPLVGHSEAAWISEMLAQLAARLGVLLAGGAEHALPPAEAGSRQVMIRRLIHEYHVRHFALAELARHLGVSPARAGHAVREACGTSFLALLTAERLATAARLLRETTLPVTEVARSAGFADVSRFHACFRARHGVTPGSFRRHGTAPESTSMTTE